MNALFKSDLFNCPQDTMKFSYYTVHLGMVEESRLLADIGRLIVASLI